MTDPTHDYVDSLEAALAKEREKSATLAARLADVKQLARTEHELLGQIVNALQADFPDQCQGDFDIRAAVFSIFTGYRRYKEDCTAAQQEVAGLKEQNDRLSALDRINEVAELEARLAQLQHELKLAQGYRFMGTNDQDEPFYEKVDPND